MRHGSSLDGPGGQSRWIGRIALVAALLVCSLAIAAGGAAAAATEAGDETVNLTTDGPVYWEGQTLSLQAPDDAGGEYALYEANESADGTFRTDGFVTEVALDGDGVGTLDTVSLGPGSYVLTDGDGDAVVVDSGSVAGTRDRLAEGIVTVREQSLFTTLESTRGAPGETLTATLTSTRGSYNVTVSSPSLNDEAIVEAFGSTTLSVDSTSTSVPVTVPAVPDESHVIEFSVADATASDSVSLLVDSNETADDSNGTDDGPATLTRLDSAGQHWIGQHLAVDGGDAGAVYTLYEDDEFVTELPLNDSGVGVIDTGQEWFDAGEYVLRNGDGEAVVLDDGSVSGTVDDGNVSEAAFTVREQELSAFIGVADAAPGETVTLSTISTRANYTVSVSSADLSTAQLRETFGATTFGVNSSDATRTVTVPDGDGANVDVTLDVTDADASTTVTFSIADWDFGGEPADPDSDGLLEDVDGNGDTDLFDVLDYFNNGGSDLVQNNVDAFDFDDDGDAGDLFDALALWNEIAQ